MLTWKILRLCSVSWGLLYVITRGWGQRQTGLSLSTWMCTDTPEPPPHPHAKIYPATLRPVWRDNPKIPHWNPNPLQRLSPFRSWPTWKKSASLSWLQSAFQRLWPLIKDTILTQGSYWPLQTPPQQNKMGIKCVRTWTMIPKRKKNHILLHEVKSKYITYTDRHSLWEWTHNLANHIWPEWCLHSRWPQGSS